MPEITSPENPLPVPSTISYTGSDTRKPFKRVQTRSSQRSFHPLNQIQRLKQPHPEETGTDPGKTGTLYGSARKKFVHFCLYLSKRVHFKDEVSYPGYPRLRGTCRNSRTKPGTGTLHNPVPRFPAQIRQQLMCPFEGIRIRRPRQLPGRFLRASPARPG